MPPHTPLTSPQYNSPWFLLFYGLSLLRSTLVSLVTDHETFPYKLQIPLIKRQAVPLEGHLCYTIKPPPRLCELPPPWAASTEGRSSPP